MSTALSGKPPAFVFLNDESKGQGQGLGKKDGKGERALVAYGS